MLTNWIKLVSKKAPHSAFTDLCEFDGKLFCCFREANNHISADGHICVVQFNTQGQELHRQIIRLSGADLRDPKLSVTPDNKLLLLAFARHCDPRTNHTYYGQPTTWFSVDGNSFSCDKVTSEKHWWLWRLRWHQKSAYGIAYNRNENRVKLWSGDPRRNFECIQPNLFSLQKDSKGYPNESDMFFDKADTAFAILRRDADSCTAQLGISRSPYKNWQWCDLGVYIGGPNMIQRNDNNALIAGRIWQKNGPKTAIVNLELHSKKLNLLSVLPSAGDNSYPGMVITGNKLYISYYSSHQHSKSCIYLAELELSE